MSIELPPIPAIPAADAASAQWDVYLRILGMYVARESREAIDAQTTQMAAMTQASQAHALLMQQYLDQPQVQAEGFSEAGVLSLVSLLMRLPVPSGG